MPPFQRLESGVEVLTEEWVDPRLTEVEALARWMDYQFEAPGGFRFGFAGLIGIVPGIGDVIDAVLSLYIVMRAIQLGIPRVAIARMTINVGIEALLGAVPFLGAIFDTVFKANRRNYQLLRNHLTQPSRQGSRDWLFLFITLALVLAGIAIPIWFLSKLFRLL